MNCPVCDSDQLEAGERVDVGWGSGDYGIKAGPDYCHNCGYTEQGPDPNDYPIEYYIDCWKRKVDPHPKLKTVKIKIKTEHAEWILSNVEKDGFGQCLKYSGMMVDAFPELRIVCGKYYCPHWGERVHYWCVDMDLGIVDATAAQFPSNGRGVYVGDFFVDKKGLRNGI